MYDTGIFLRRSEMLNVNKRQIKKKQNDWITRISAPWQECVMTVDYMWEPTQVLSGTEAVALTLFAVAPASGLIDG